MRMSQLFFRTLRETPADAEVTSHRLMLRAGLVHQVAAGIFDYLPLGLRVKRKVEEIMRQEMDAIGGQEVSLPVVQPAELWQRSGRWSAIGSDMARLVDAGGRDMCLGMTHEEVVTALAADVLSSYKQLPFMLYQIQTKFRDEPRPRGGMIRVREFTMKDGYSFHVDQADLDAYYPSVYQAYFNIFNRAGLETIAVESDTGMMGGSMAHEFMALTPVGEDTLLICESCDYRANRQIAAVGDMGGKREPALPLEEVATPDTSTITALAQLLEIGEDETAKAVFLIATIAGSSEAEPAREQLVFAVLRGDTELNETKLTNAIKALNLRPAQAEEIERIGAVAGYASPIGIDRSAALVVADPLLTAGGNFVAGANKRGFHLRNVNYGRDWDADLVVDLVAAAEGHPCPNCGAAMIARRGVEVGNIFKLGTKYSESMGARFLDDEGGSHAAVMGCYGIGTGRLIASVIENSHDEQGIIWPISIAPYEVSLVSLATARTPEVAEAAEQVYESLSAAGIELLFDEREERAGVKFNDAELLGIPLRLTLGARGLAEGILEYKLRRNGESGTLPLEGLADAVQALLDREHALLAEALREMPLG
jgi:prolyl-tRNA synthetase